MPITRKATRKGLGRISRIRRTDASPPLNLPRWAGDVTLKDQRFLPTERIPMPQRVLVLTDENLAVANEVPESIRPLIGEAEEIYVIAPTLTTWLQSLTGDIDAARLSADERLQTVFEHMRASGLEPRGTVGDEDQVAAIGDALAGFDADLIVLRLHAPGSENENWREHRLAKRARSQFGVPTMVFFFDSEGQVVGREEA